MKLKLLALLLCVLNVGCANQSVIATRSDLEQLRRDVKIRNEVDDEFSEMILDLQALHDPRGRSYESPYS